MHTFGILCSGWANDENGFECYTVGQLRMQQWKYSKSKYHKINNNKRWEQQQQQLYKQNEQINFDSNYLHATIELG